MDPMLLYPLHDDTGLLCQHGKLPLHAGRGTIGSQWSEAENHQFVKLHRFLNPSAPALADVTFDAAFVTPGAGPCHIFLQCRKDFWLSRDFYTDLAVDGEVGGEPFALRCSEIYVETTGEGAQGRNWAIAKPLNQSAVVTYGASRPVARVQALINNFDFAHGNEPQQAVEQDVLRVRAGGRTVDFAKREGYEQIKTLMRMGAIGPAPLLSFTFDAWDQASEDDLANFAHHVAGLCGLVARQHTGIPVLSFLDGDGRAIQRRINNPLESAYRENNILPALQAEWGLPQLFAECFSNYQQMHDSERWRSIPNFCRTVEDPMFLEQKCAQLMAGLERLMRNALIEDAGWAEGQAERLMLMELIGAVRRDLAWDIPQHYTTRERVRELRNAVAHGGPLPFPPARVRHDLDKWSLFMMRRVLMRLGFTGEVRSPNRAARQWAQSAVADFSLENNSFGE